MGGLYNIRLAKVEDLTVLPGIERKACTLFAKTKHHAAVSDDVTTLEDFEEAREEGHLFVAVSEDGKAVGFSFMEIMGHGVHLDEIDVLPKFGGKGIGTALVKKVCGWAKKNNYPVVTLTTYKEIRWNAPFYKKLGFRVLRADEMSDELQNLFLCEHESGLLMEDRVVMEYKVK